LLRCFRERTAPRLIRASWPTRNVQSIDFADIFSGVVKGANRIHR
jgi:hypothetical protein